MMMVAKACWSQKSLTTGIIDRKRAGRAVPVAADPARRGQGREPLEPRQGSAVLAMTRQLRARLMACTTSSTICAVRGRSDTSAGMMID